MSDSSRRALYRVVYPLVERPTFVVGRNIYEVIDCSEQGLRFELSDRPAPALGTELGGTIRFRRGQNVAISGEVIRITAGMVVLALEPSIPFGEIIAEQRYLRGKGYTLRD